MCEVILRDRVNKRVGSRMELRISAFSSKIGGTWVYGTKLETQKKVTGAGAGGRALSESD